MTTIIKTITLWEPWATLIAIGAKRYETRSWTPYKLGTIAIHASKNRGAECVESFRQEPFRSVLAAAGFERFEDLRFGCVAALVRIVKVHPTEPLVSTLSEQELAFGDYRPNRKAWELANVQPLKNPIPATGAQGLWDWEAPDGLLESYLRAANEEGLVRKSKPTRPVPTALDQ